VKSPSSSLRKTGMTQKLQKHASFASPSVISQENSFMGKSFNEPIKTAEFSGNDFYKAQNESAMIQEWLSQGKITRQ
jgi:hypothetical protein